jgi:AcrR family transcriptional regulator
LFLADGYVATTLEAVARRARVGARTVYLRFGTKAALFKRVIDVAIVGDTQPVDVLGRDWMRDALTAPTAAERLTYLLITRLTGWDLDAYQDWLIATGTRLALSPASSAPPAPPES